MHSRFIGRTALCLAITSLLASHSAPSQPTPAPQPCKIGDLVRVEYEATATREDAKKREGSLYLTTISMWAYGTLTQSGPDFITVSAGYYRWSDGNTYDTRHLTIARKSVRSVVTLKLDQTVALPGNIAPSTPALNTP